MDMIFDFGNARGKWFNPRTNLYGDFRHALVELKAHQWETAVGRSKTPPQGFIKVNGVPYVIGDAARRYVIAERPHGASRYRREYYGVAMAYAIAEAFKKSVRNITLCATHAPVDIGYARNLRASAIGDWQVECEHGELTFNVRDVQTIDEPLAGYSHYVFTERGEERKKNPLAKVTTLVIDVGGYTTDVIAVDPGGQIDLLSGQSTRTGVIELVEGFERGLRAQYSTMFQDTGNIDIRRLEDAILSGSYRFGKLKLECDVLAQEAIAGLVNDVVQVINKAGGVANFEVMLLTGGGAALIYDTLCDALPRADFYLAEPNRDLMKFANVFGGAKVISLLRVLGEI